MTIGVFRDHPVEGMIAPFVERFRVSWPVARDPERTLLGKLGITKDASYAVVMLDTRGRLATRIEGFGKPDLETLESAIERELRTGAGT